MSRYDGTLRTSQGQVIQFLYGEDGMDAVWIEKQNFESFTLKASDFERVYALDTTEDKFGFDEIGLPFIESAIIEDCKNDPTVQMSLDEELEQLQEDRRNLRVIMANREAGAEDSPSSYAPGNVKRVIRNARQQFKIGKNNVSDLHPRDVLQMVQDMLLKLTVVDGSDGLSVEAQANATLLYSILIRGALSVKRVLKEYR